MAERAQTMTYSPESRRYIASVDGVAHLSAIEAIERLATEVTRLRDVVSARDDMDVQHGELIDALQAEVKRLARARDRKAASAELVYLASPYSHSNGQLRELRYRAACAAAAYLIQGGTVVFSPIVHSHPLGETYDLPTDWTFWGRHCTRMLEAADRLVVLCLAGWEQSEGIRAEVEIAGALGKPVSYMLPPVRRETR